MFTRHHAHSFSIASSDMEPAYVALHRAGALLPRVEFVTVILRFLAEGISPDTYVNLMDQYHPAGKVNARTFAEINRRLGREEAAAALDAARRAGIWRLDRRRNIWATVAV